MADTFPVNVKVFSEDVILIETSSNDTVEVVKQKIHGKDIGIMPGIPMEDISVFLQSRKLDTSRKISDCKITEESMLILVWERKHLIYVRLMDIEKSTNLSFPLEIQTSQTILDLKNAIGDKMNILPRKMRLFVHGEDDEGFSRQLKDEKILSEYNLPKIITRGLVLKICPFEIPFKNSIYDGVIAKIMAEPTDPYESFRDFIKAEIGLSANQYNLAIAGQVMKEGFVLQSLGLGNLYENFSRRDSTNIHLVFTKSLVFQAVEFKISNGKCVQLDVSLSFLVKFLKKIVELKSGVPAHQQTLYLNGNQLRMMQENKPFSHYVDNSPTKRKNKISMIVIVNPTN